MSLAGDMLTAGEALLVATHSMESVTISSVAYQCFIMESDLMNDLEIGGFTNENFHKVAIPRNLITSIPTEGDTVSFRGATLYVQRVQRDDAEAPIVVDFGPDTSKRNS